jgi:ArsR family transcriptional regulator
MMLLCEIGQGEKCVSELEDALDLHQPTLSQQLTVLRKEKLVKTRREGKQIYYSLASEVVVSVISLLYKHYCKK